MSTEKNFTLKLARELDPSRQDAVWYYGEKHIGTATLETAAGKKFSVEIYCDGETRAHLPYKNEDGTYNLSDFEVIRYEDQWEARGSKTDEPMQEESKKIMELGFDIWVFNSWFDLYTEINGTMQHLDAVSHEIEDAIRDAQAVLEEVEELGSWEKYFDTH